MKNEEREDGRKKSYRMLFAALLKVLRTYLVFLSSILSSVRLNFNAVNTVVRWVAWKQEGKYTVTRLMEGERIW